MHDADHIMPAGTTLKRRSLLLSGATALAAAALGETAGPTPAHAARILQWGSASLGSTGYVIITTLAATVSKFTKLRCSSLSTSGGAENMALIGNGTLDLAQTTSSDWQDAVAGKGRYHGHPVKALQMFSYTAWQVTPMVRADSKIKTLHDLVGKRVMPSTAGGATAPVWHTIFKAAGIEDKVQWTYGSWTETYGAFKSGAANCVPTLMTGGRPSPLMIELQTTVPIRVLDIPEELQKAAQQANPGILFDVLTPAQEKYLSAPTAMVSAGGILAANPRVDEQTGYEITKAILDHASFVRSKGEQLQDVSLAYATKFLIPAYPVHPGAARYLKEKGVWRNDLKVASL